GLPFGRSRDRPPRGPRDCRRHRGRGARRRAGARRVSGEGGHRRMSAPALAVHGLHAYYGESHVLQGIDLEVARGEAVALIGRNGAGKTTTIAAIAGALMRNPSVLLLDEPSEGLAPKLVEQVGEILKTLRATGLALLSSSRTSGSRRRSGSASSS